MCWGGAKPYFYGMNSVTPTPTVVKLIFWGDENYKTPDGRYMVVHSTWRHRVNNVEGTRACHGWKVWDCESKDYLRMPHSEFSFKDCLAFLAKHLGVSKVTAPKGRNKSNVP